MFNPVVTIVSLLQLPHHGPILECLFLIFLSSTLNPWAAHFNCADFFPLVTEKSRVDPICSNLVVLLMGIGTLSKDDDDGSENVDKKK